MSFPAERKTTRKSGDVPKGKDKKRCLALSSGGRPVRAISGGTTHTPAPRSPAPPTSHPPPPLAHPSTLAARGVVETSLVAVGRTLCPIATSGALSRLAPHPTPHTCFCPVLLRAPPQPPHTQSPRPQPSLVSVERASGALSLPPPPPPTHTPPPAHALSPHPTPHPPHHTLNTHNSYQTTPQTMRRGLSLLALESGGVPKGRDKNEARTKRKWNG